MNRESGMKSNTQIILLNVIKERNTIMVIALEIKLLEHNALKFFPLILINKETESRRL